MSFHVILSSDSSLTTFPGNTLSSFTTQLLEELKFPSEENWQVALQAISLSKCVAQGSRLTKIYIHTDCIRKAISSDPNPNLLRVIDISKYSQNHLYYEAESREYFPLNDSHIRNINIYLRDENNNPVQLLAGQPTYLKLKFKQIMDRESFVLQLSSNQTKNIFSRNTLSNFISELDYPIQMTGKWQVGLSSVMLPAKIAPVVPINMLSIQIYEPMNISTMKEIRFEPENFMTNDILKMRLKQKLKAAGNIKVSFDDKDRLLLLATSDHGYKLTISEMLAHILGHRQSRGGYEADGITSINIPGKKAGKSDRIIQFTHRIDVSRLHQNLILLNCDIITPIHTSGTKTRLLKLIPLDTTKGYGEPFINYESKYIDYVNVEKNHISRINMELRRTDGELVDFLTDKDQVNISLIFRKVSE